MIVKTRPLVLNVDDDEAGRYAISHMLRASGMDVREVGTGEEALEMLEDVDLVLLDINLPGIDGIEVCRRIKSAQGTRTLPVLHLTASRIEPDDKVFGLENGADAYLSEPITREELVATVRAHIRARRSLEREATRRLEFERQLVGVVSHDLRSPLSSIILDAHVLESSPDPVFAKAAARVGRVASRMARMVSELLDFTQARLGDGIPIQPRDCDLVEICRRTADELRAMHKNREVVFSGLAAARGFWDEDRMQQVLVNLLTNAFVHSPEGSEVRIDVQKDVQHDMQQAVQQGDGPVTLTIANENRVQPIPADLLRVLFEPFTHGARGEHQSIGLGLFIVDHIVRAHEGSISVASDDVGTRFSLWLPTRRASL